MKKFETSVIIIETCQIFIFMYNSFTVKVSKYGVFSGPYFAVFRPNTGKCGPEITPHLDTFHAAIDCKTEIFSHPTALHMLQTIRPT